MGNGLHSYQELLGVSIYPFVALFPTAAVPHGCLQEGIAWWMAVLITQTLE